VSHIQYTDIMPLPTLWSVFYTHDVSGVCCTLFLRLFTHNFWKAAYV